jgi:S-adenosylmethionine synthetase
MQLMIETLRATPIAHRRMELVERKGLGHPDTICDALVEAISLGLNRMYLERAGAILHYNVDKALLVAGQCEKEFGRGTLQRPIELIVGDRATDHFRGQGLPLEETAREAVDRWVAENLPHVRAGKDLLTRTVFAPGSGELRAILPASVGIVSNDSAGVSGYAPLSPTEETVLAVERFLNGPDFKRQFPDSGQDVKVLGIRRDRRLSLTVAMPLLCSHIPAESAYFRRKDDVLAALTGRFPSDPFELEWRLNCLDQRGRGADGTYLTLLGTSAEDADSGQVGRGNRVNGLIAFARPAGGEAAAGKNPLAHVGKVYNVLSTRLAQLIHARCPALEEVYVHLATRIGTPVDQPWVGVQIVSSDGTSADDIRPMVRDVVEAELGRMPDFCAELIRGAYSVC